MPKKTCFVISPIGEEGSDVRKHADDFLELLVEPALAKYGFTVIRADKIARASIITNDIVELVQQSDLCLVDLSFHNPNVFYECGRRHETGRPTIQLIKKGDSLPFDVAGIRTLEYSLEDPRSTLESVKNVSRFIEEIDSTNSYGAQGSGASLTTIASTLARIEKKLSTPTYQQGGMDKAGSISKKELITMHPSQAFHKAMELGDVESARFVLPRVKKFMGFSPYIQALSVLAETADEASKDELLELIPSLIEDKSYKELRVALVGLTDYFTTTAAFDKAILTLKPIIISFSDDEKEHPANERAFALNRLQMMRYQEEEYSEALVDALRVVELAPTDNSYWYNLSLIQKKLERYTEAAESVLNFVQYSDSPQDHHLEHVREVLVLAGREAEFDKVLETLANK